VAAGLFLAATTSVPVSVPRLEGQASSNFCESQGLWKGTGSLNTPRARFTATLLKDGRVLVAGGISGSSSTATAEVYNPATGRFTTVAPMMSARFDHFAVLLPSGRVLIGGGFSSPGAGNPGRLDSAEEFEPGSGRFFPTGTMTTDRQGAAAVLLANGRVLITGGFGRLQQATAIQPAYSGALPTAEIYDPNLRTFTATCPVPAPMCSTANGAMTIGREYHTATLLKDGRVLVAGGYTSQGDATNIADIFDPNTGAFTPTATTMRKARYQHTATALPDGNVRIAGGGNVIDGVLRSVEFFNPVSGSFAPVGDMSSPRAQHAAVLLPTGATLYIGGSAGTATGGASTNTVEKYFGGTAAPALSARRLSAQAILLNDGDVLVTGGLDQTGSPLASSDLYDPLFSVVGSLSAPHVDHTATLLTDGEVLIAGGANVGTASVNTAGLFRPVSNSFTPIPGTMAVARRQHNAIRLQDGTVLITGGLDGLAPVAAAELFDPVTKTFTAVGAMTTPRVHHSATELPGGRVLIAGGWAIGGGLKSAEVFDPATKTFVATAGDMTFDHYSHSGSPLPSGRVLIAGGWSDADHGPTNVRAITYTTEIFTAATGTFAFQPQLNRLLTNRTDQTATVLAAGQLLLAGGLATGSISPTDSAETYDAGSNMFTNTANRMSRSRRLHTATLTNLPRGQVMIVGGDDQSIGPHEVDLYDPTTQRFAPAPDTIQFPRMGHTATLLLDGRVLIVGGAQHPTTAEVSKTTNCGPVIETLTPAAGHIGEMVSIRGRGFNFVQGPSSVTFNGVSATPTAWAPGLIQVTVPGGATTGPVVVTVNGVASNAKTYSVFVSSDIELTAVVPAIASALAAVTVTMTVRNNGPDTATSTLVRLPPPALLQLMPQPPGGRGAPPKPRCVLQAGLIACGVGTLASGASVSFALVFQPTTRGMTTIQSEARSTTPDPFPGNNLATAVLTIR